MHGWIIVPHALELEPVKLVDSGVLVELGSHSILDLLHEAEERPFVPLQFAVKWSLACEQRPSDESKGIHVNSFRVCRMPCIGKQLRCHVGRSTNIRCHFISLIVSTRADC